MSNRSAAKRLVLRFAGRLLAVGALWCGSSALVHAQGRQYTPADILAIRPKCEDVVVSTPDAAGLAACKLEAPPGGRSGYVLKDGAGQTLRRFMDVSGGGRVDQYSYFKDNVEVYRETLTKAGLNIRWIQTGGMKSGIAQQTSAGRIRIVAWQMISAEEAAYEAFQALATGDAERLQAVLITPQEIASLGLPAADAQKLTTQVAGAAAKLAAVRTKVPEIATAKFARLESAQAGAYPTDITGGTNEIVKITHGLILYDNPTAKKQNDFINAPEMIQVGLAWRLTDSPSPDNGIEIEPKLKTALDELAKIDAAHPKGSKGAEVIEWNKARAHATAEVAKHCPANERESWYKQVVDGYAAATSLKDADATTMLSKIKDNFAAAQKGGSLAAYVTYREIWALYQAEVDGVTGEKFIKAQTKYHEALKKFVVDYARAEDAPDALIQLAMGGEFTGKEQEAKNYYQQIVENFPAHPNRPKAEGAIRRLDSVGKALDLTSPVLGNPVQRFSMSQVAGKVAVIYYWSTLSSQTGADFASLKKLQDDYAKDLAIVCVNLDDEPANATAYAQKNAAFATHLHQPGQPGQPRGMNGPLATQYGIFGLPQVFLVGADGKVVSNKIQINMLDDEIAKLTKK